MGYIDIDNVSFSYTGSSVNSLDSINLTVEEGEFLAVMGENGSGKTTLLKLINGIIPHLSFGCLKGTVTVDGQCTKESSVPQLALKAGIVFDDPDAQIFTSTVFHEAAFGPENILLPPEEIMERVNFALNAVGLNGFEDRLPSTLSGGEKQRLVIASALAMKSKILVLDEPLCRLDSNGARDVMAVLNDIRGKYKITIIMATHDSEMTVKYADRVCILKNGKIAALDFAKNIFADNALLELNGIRPIINNKEFTTNQSNTRELAVRNLSDVRDGSCGLWLKNPIIHISNLSFNYNKSNTCIENLNLSIAENDFIAIIGKNGCGKTTLLKNITGLLRPQSGDIFINGKNIKYLSISDISMDVGYVMQNPDTQLFTDSVYNEAAFALKNLRLSKKEIKNRIEEALEITGLKDKDAFPHALNRADKTKTLITCILAMGCRILILDEIDVGNDYRGCLKIMDIMRNLHKKGFTIIFVTHNMYLVNEYALRVIEL